MEEGSMCNAIHEELYRAAPVGEVRLSPDALVAMLVDAYEAGRDGRPIDDARRTATSPRVARAGGGRRT
jgi:hypothetical protein